MLPAMVMKHTHRGERELIIERAAICIAHATQEVATFFAQMILQNTFQGLVRQFTPSVKEVTPVVAEKTGPFPRASRSTAYPPPR